MFVSALFTSFSAWEPAILEDHLITTGDYVIILMSSDFENTV